MDDALRRALRRARELSRPVLAADSLPVHDAPVALKLFASAEAQGERRFFSGHPDVEHELLGLGCAWELAPGSDAGFSDIRERARVAFAHCVSREPVRLCVSPDGVQEVTPPTAGLSVFLPGASGGQTGPASPT